MTDVFSMNLNDIKPQEKGMSDKYSWNLYKFLKYLPRKNKNYSFHNVEIHWLHESYWDGAYMKSPDEGGDMNITQVLIVPVNNGNRWSFFNFDAVLREGKAEEFSFEWTDTKDITEWFFENYLSDGRCIWDRNHNGWMLGDKERFEYSDSGNKRVCNWCGLSQEKEIKVKRKLVVEKMRNGCER